MCVFVCVNLMRGTSKEDAAVFDDRLEQQVEIWRMDVLNMHSPFPIIKGRKKMNPRRFKLTHKLS